MDLTDAELAAHLRDPSADAGFLPQWVRNDLAERLERAELVRQRLTTHDPRKKD